ncbi:MAG: hypothetical protein C0594_14620 [Marinilabiliales bacterium]|nr:MAG: hypothetical protein C0594_14620 [Marinilabiliales bacterium]
MYTFWLVLVTIVWGSTFFIVKETVDSVDEFLLVFIRNIIATIPMLIYAIIKEGKKLFRYQEIWQGSLLGLMLSGTYISQTIGLKFTSTGHSAFITGSAVLFVPFILFTFFRTKLG